MIPDHPSDTLRELARERHVDSLLRNIPGMLYHCRLDAHWTMLFISAGCLSLTGYRPDDLLYNRRVAFVDLLHPEDTQRLEDEVYRAIEAREAYSITYRLITAHGDEKWVWEQGNAVRGEQDEVLALEGYITDITQRIELEAQLVRSQRMESVGQLTGGVAHDFNNLLTVILGNAELLVEELDNQPRLANLADMVVSAAQRGSDLTQSLLAYARRQPLEPRAIEVDETLQGMYDLLHRTLGEHIEVDIIAGSHGQRAMVDPSQLENALLNLSLNARDAMPQGGNLVIETAVTHLDQYYADHHDEVEPGDYIMVAVSDTGEGIDSGHLERVFEPFFTTKSAGKGTGLGLSMIYGFIKQSRGHVSIYSEPGQGTTVKMYLPLADGEAGDAHAELAAAETEGGGETILLVEDDDLVRRYAHQQLAALGYLVSVAASGREALAMIRQRDDIDLLFTDIVMPGGINGKELADRARAIRPTLKVLYTSGYTENAIVHQGRLDPGVLLLSKPYRHKELARTVRQALDSAQAKE
ncbi:ATP-binding protein [Aidingimonas lacisalsi]|uniref:ATP-binding protein n=1 Tax=Aidingimonas lacisalsi TaxID=2604086 RepID=UPI0011D2034D|nr:ATP-binding protein [Aidingimonas lacisalsi]